MFCSASLVITVFRSMLLVVILMSQVMLWPTDVNYSCIVLMFRLMRVRLSGTRAVQSETVNTMWHTLALEIK
jgi:hypothetical protein